MIEKYRHISFDLDGTLVHTVPEYRHRVVPRVVAGLGGVIHDDHSVDRFWFEPNRNETIRREFALEPEVFWPLFRKIDTIEERSSHTHPYEDSARALHTLKTQGKTVSILTGAPHWIAEMEIEKLNGAPHDFHISLIQGKFKNKPDPESFRHALQQLRMNPSETVYIGNAGEDAAYAKNAGVDFMYLERKEHEFTLREYAVAVIHSLDELVS